MLNTRVKDVFESLAILCAVVFFAREVGSDLLTMVFGRQTIVISIVSTNLERVFLPEGPSGRIPSSFEMMPSAIISFADDYGNVTTCNVVGRNKLFGNSRDVDESRYADELKTLQLTTNFTARVRSYPRIDCYLHSPFTFIHGIFITLLAYSSLRFGIACFAMAARRRVKNIQHNN